MKLLLDIERIKLIFSEYREFIGPQKLDGLDSIIAGIGFFITIALSDFHSVKWLQITPIVIAILYLMWGTYHLYRSWKYSDFNRHKLLELLEEINEMEKHPHSIILIKDDFNKNSNRFLVYDDPRWHCRLFPNYHTISASEEENISNIQHHIRMELKTTTENGCFLFQKLHSKYSVSSQKEKVYLHRFYRFQIKGNPEITQDSFCIDGKTYHWMSIAEMEADENIMQSNSDIVGFVKQQAI